MLWFCWLLVRLGFIKPTPKMLLLREFLPILPKWNPVTGEKIQWSKARAVGIKPFNPETGTPTEWKLVLCYSEHFFRSLYTYKPGEATVHNKRSTESYTDTFDIPLLTKPEAVGYFL